MAKLGVNIDHVATLRQARREFEPDPIIAAQIALKNGADSIVAHLREDRRHIIDSDIKRLRAVVKKHFNLEMSLNPSIVAIACKIKPDQATIVPERREEITTEGGLNVTKHFASVRSAVKKLTPKGIKVSLFIAADPNQIMKAKDTGATIIELHTGTYDHAKGSARKKELDRLIKATQLGIRLGLTVNAGHGLKYDNVKDVAQIPGIYELNIGHSIITRAVFVGLPTAVREMKGLIS